MRVSKKIYFCASAALLGIAAALYAGSIFVADKEPPPNGEHARHIKEVRESLLLQAFATKLLFHSQGLAFDLPDSHEESVIFLGIAREELQSLLEESSQYSPLVADAGPSGDGNPKWEAFLRIRAQCGIYAQNLLHLLDKALADPTPQALSEIRQYAAEKHGKHLQIIADLNENVLKLTDTDSLPAPSVMKMPNSNAHYIISILFFVASLLSVIFITIFFFPKKVFKKTIKRFAVFLKRLRRGGRAGRRIAGSSGERHENLNIIFQSLQAKVRAIAEGTEILTKGIRQIMADQTNLYSLNSAIEAARPQADGFAVISSEILALSMRTGRFMDDICDVAQRLRGALTDVTAELEQARQCIGPASLGLPAKTGAPADGGAEGAGRLSEAVSKVAAGLDAAIGSLQREDKPQR